MAGESDAEPTLRVKGVGGVQGALDDGGEGAAGLGRSDSFGEETAQGGVSQEVKGSAPVGDGAAYDVVGSVGGDHPFLQGGIAGGAGRNRFGHGLPLGFQPCNGLHELKQERVNDEAVVVVGVQGWAISVGAVAEIPCCVLAEGEADPHTIEGLAELVEAGFDHGSEEEPVVEGWQEGAGGAKAFGELLTDGRREGVAELFGGTGQGESEEGGVDDGLAVLAEVEVVGGLLIDAVRDGCAGQIGVLEAHRAFVASVGSGFEPRGDAGKGSAESFKVSDAPAVGLVARSRLDGHGGVELASAERGEDRVADAVEHGEPVGALRWPVCSRPCRRCGGGHGEAVGKAEPGGASGVREGAEKVAASHGCASTLYWALPTVCCS